MNLRHRQGLDLRATPGSHSDALTLLGGLTRRRARVAAGPVLRRGGLSRLSDAPSALPELVAAKRYSGRHVRAASRLARGMADTLWKLEIDGLAPERELAAWAARLDAVTSEDVRRTAARLFDRPDGAIAVGEKAASASLIQASGRARVSQRGERAPGEAQRGVWREPRRRAADSPETRRSSATPSAPSVLCVASTVRSLAPALRLPDRQLPATREGPSDST